MDEDNPNYQKALERVKQWVEGKQIDDGPLDLTDLPSVSIFKEIKPWNNQMTEVPPLPQTHPANKDNIK